MFVGRGRGWCKKEKWKLFRGGEKGGIILARQDFDRVVRDIEFNDKNVQFDQHYRYKKPPDLSSSIHKYICIL
jgi:hypothetical protein